MKNEYYNKFYDYPSEIKKPLENIVGFRQVNIPRTKNTIIASAFSNRCSFFAEVINDSVKHIFKKCDSYYIAHDRTTGIIKIYSEKPSMLTAKPCHIKLDVYGQGKVFKNLGISRNKMFKLYYPDNQGDLIKKYLGIETVSLSICQQHKTFAYSKSVTIDKRIIDYKLAQAGMIFIDYKNDVTV